MGDHPQDRVGGTETPGTPDHELDPGDGHDPVPSVTDVTSLPPARGMARPLVGAVRLYQHAAGGRPSPCRHVPSCSTYAIEALQLHGAARGSWLAFRRLVRCQPWGSQGYDPVPDRKAT